MLHNIKNFAKYGREFGWSNAAIFSFYKLFPRKFVLLSRKVNGAAWPGMSDVDYSASLYSVLDYVSWREFGGADVPVPQVAKDGRDCFVWFVPDWTNVWGGGHYTLFRFANHFASFGTRNIIYIYDNHRHATPDALQKELDGALKNCKLEVVVDAKKLPACTGAIATTWQSAYPVRAFPHARKKFYFMQDYESHFYAHGTMSMQANATYTFGFAGITGGGWLKKCYESHGGRAQNYRFAADKSIFYPASDDGIVRPQVKRVFFYGRPSTERRCFELGMVALRKIADKFPDVEIVIAGLDLQAPPPFKATLLGNMSLKATGDLYRTCDIGIAFSGTNLSYLPVELMASGVPVISNNGPQVEWHCTHLKNAYLADPTPQAVLEAFSELYHDRALRQSLVNGGLETMAPLTWEDEMSKIYQYVKANLEEPIAQ